MDKMGMHVVLSGNPVDGLTVWGPFTTGEDAVNWASDELDCDWWAAPLAFPVTGEPE